MSKYCRNKMGIKNKFHSMSHSALCEEKGVLLHPQAEQDPCNILSLSNFKSLESVNAK